ncbi:hypothetical protein AGMMS50230_11220 [Spirochaetia bacterium]|nr:hypothetical protein AGMMS50230_11220 [Spirochaetia bacterium]
MNISQLLTALAKSAEKEKPEDEAAKMFRGSPVAGNGLRPYPPGG